MADHPRRASRRSPSTPPRSTAAVTKGKKEDPMTADPVEPALDRIVRAYHEYKRALEEAVSSRELQRRLGDAQREYWRAYGDAIVPPQVREQATQAFQAYGKALREATTPEQLRQQATDAFAGYKDTAQNLISPDQAKERAAKAYVQYAREVQGVLAPDELRDKVAAARRAYVQALGDALSSAGDSLDSAALCSVAQIVTAACALGVAGDAAVRQSKGAADAMGAAVLATRGAAGMDT
jgi:hypothetical protein